MTFVDIALYRTYRRVARPRFGPLLLRVVLAVTAVGFTGCRTDGAGAGPPVPASSDPAGNDLVPGAIVVAVDETRNAVRIYKLVSVKYFPPPVGDELVMVAFNEMGKDFRHAADLWQQRKLTVALPKVRVQRQQFAHRNYRVIQQEPVSEQDKKLKPQDPIPPKMR